jgi:alpha-ketoglutarate-dependent taurine dioxygenase
VSLSELNLVETSSFDGRRLPLVMRPSRAGVDLADWANANRELVTAKRLEHGAILFRGFGLGGATDFEAAAGALAQELYGDYGDLPREAASEKIFSSTPYPNDEMIHFHNESSHMARWPMQIFFFSATVAPVGGATPILDCRSILDDIDASVVEEFDAKGLQYVRNFADGVDVPWQTFFGTDDPAEVERHCEESGTTAEWLRDGAQLRIRQQAVAVARHPRTDDRVWFNQVLLHHPFGVPAATRASLLELFDADDLPRNVYFGDGSPIPDSVMEHLYDTYMTHRVEFAWEQGDVLMLDNMLTAHGRMPFEGPRKILVAMAEIVEGGTAAA